MKTFRYAGEYAREVSMPVGGIGAGCIGLAGNGELTDWEIQHPNKGAINPFTHFAVKAETAAGVVARVLQGDHTRELIGKYSNCRYNHFGYGYGPDSGTMAGFPHFSECEFEGAFPWARLRFSDEAFPAQASLSAFSSFIPGNADDSSLPCAFYRVELTNTASETVTYTVSLTLGSLFKQSENRAFREGGLTGLTVTEGENGLCAVTDAPLASVQSNWFRAGWFDGPTVYWNQYEKPGFLPERAYETPGSEPGVVEARFTLAPGQSCGASFVISWYYPHVVNDWSGNDRTPWKNWYATRFSSARDAAEYAMKNRCRLARETLLFRDALYSATIPERALEAAGASLSILVTPVCLRLEDGSFYGWEGASELGGSCEGSCQHVWNYAYALPYLFPELEQSVRRLEKNYSQWDDGRISFRLQLPLGSPKGWKMPCVDGQMGYILKIYREWKFGGDENWLREMFPSAKRALEFAWQDTDVKWDPDQDGILDGRQHHTLDMELFGPSSWLEGLYLAALKAMAEMARALGEDGGEYDRLYENGRKFLNEELFNGEYYFQKVNLKDRAQLSRFGNVEGHFVAGAGGADHYWNEETGEIRYQIGEGLIIDQALAQWHANLMGLGQIFDKDQLKIALKSLYKYNFKPAMREFCNPCRIFSLNDEAGTVMCEYPDIAYKPIIPVPYCQETMTGFEYAAASLMLQEGLIDEALTMIAAVRDRYDGKKRNPYNEIECGSNYSRSMAAFSFVPVWEGFSCDAVKGEMGFQPMGEIPMRGLWFLGGAWGEIALDEKAAILTVRHGELKLSALTLPFPAVSAKADGEAAEFACEGGRIAFASPVRAKKALVLALENGKA